MRAIAEQVGAAAVWSAEVAESMGMDLLALRTAREQYGEKVEALKMRSPTAYVECQGLLAQMDQVVAVVDVSCSLLGQRSHMSAAVMMVLDQASAEEAGKVTELWTGYERSWAQRVQPVMTAAQLLRRFMEPTPSTGVTKMAVTGGVLAGPAAVAAWKVAKWLINFAAGYILSEIINKARDKKNGEDGDENGSSHSGASSFDEEPVGGVPGGPDHPLPGDPPDNLPEDHDLWDYDGDWYSVYESNDTFKLIDAIRDYIRREDQ